MRTQFDEMLKAWLSGDVDAIGKTFNRDLQSSPELKAALLTRRNWNWSQWIERRMTQPGTVMVAVGAGHLAAANRSSAIFEPRLQGPTSPMTQQSALLVAKNSLLADFARLFLISW